MLVIFLFVGYQSFFCCDPYIQKRGANIYAEFLGGSFTCDAYHMTEPHPEGNVPSIFELVVFLQIR